MTVLFLLTPERMFMCRRRPRFTGPVLVAMLLSAITSMEKPSESEVEEDQAIQSMMQSMNVLASVAS